MDEHLATARTKLLAIDEAARARPPARALPREVRDAFRALHTIKGLSAMVGVESVVTAGPPDGDRAARRRPQRRPVRRELATALLLEGVRVVERSIESVGRGSRTGDPPPQPLLDALDALESAEAAASSPPVARLDLEGDDRRQARPLRDASSSRRRCRATRSPLRVEFVPSADRAGRGVTITHVREKLGAFTEVVKIVPLSGAAGGAGGLRFVILLVAPPGVEARIAEVVEGEAAAVLPLAAPEPSPPSLELSAFSAEREDEEELTQPYRRNLLRVDVFRIDDAMEKLAALIVTRSRLAREVSSLAGRGVEVTELAAMVGENARQLRDLRAALLGLRMVPVGEVLDRLPLVVQGLRRTTGKRARLELEGTTEELDKSIAERLLPALLHLVRNAVDHGLEPPAERLLAGKREEGTIRIVCANRNNRQLEIVVSDDGRGIDRSLVARRARQARPEQGDTSRQISDRDLLELLCEPGLSTSREVTTTSGRGMGMDIVRRTVNELGGELSLVTTVGQGSRFTLTVPLTLTIVDAFSFLCAGERFVVPVGAIEEIFELDPTLLERPAALPGARGSSAARGAVLLQRRGETVVLLDLARSLGLVSERTRTAAFVIRRAGDAVAFAVERVVGQQEAVVRPLRDPLVQAAGRSPGTTDLGDGRATMVIDLGALATVASHRHQRGTSRMSNLVTGRATGTAGAELVAGSNEPLLHVVFRLGETDYALAGERGRADGGLRRGERRARCAVRSSPGWCSCAARSYRSSTFASASVWPPVDTPGRRVVVGEVGERRVALLVDSAREVARSAPLAAQATAQAARGRGARLRPLGEPRSKVGSCWCWISPR